MKNLIFFSFCALLFSLFNPISNIYAQEQLALNEIINYQGYLGDSDGVPLADDFYWINFSLYESENAKEAIWTETQKVTTRNGFFNVYLGKYKSFADANIKFDKTYYLGFTFLDKEEFKPRTQLSFSPYSFSAKKLIFPYVDTIEAKDGIFFTMSGKGTALQINKTGGKALVINNKGETSSAPAVSIFDSTHGTALKVSAEGFTTRAARFTTNNISARTPTVEIYNHGKGSSMFITNTNKSDTMPVIQISNQSMGYSMFIQSFSNFLNRTALKIDAMGIGGAAEFRIFNRDNVESPLITRTYGLGTGAEIYSYNKNNKNSALIVSTNAKGPVANFSILAPNNDTTGFYVMSKGKGDAVKFIVDNTIGENHALTLQSNSMGAVLYAKADNDSPAALFESNDTAGTPALKVIGNGNAPAVFATNTKGNTVAEFSISDMHATRGPVVKIEHKGGGRTLELHSTSGPLHPALYVKKDGIDGVAAIFNGHVTVNGELKKMSGSFVIDHPLDPANKLLSHSFVESPDMKNLYDGVVTLDMKGEATVHLPDWFEALNKDFRYQLTCIGGWAQVYISQEIKNNTFKIAGGKPGMKVSWMVTGTRHDPWANEHRIQVEKNKQQKGTYLFKEYYEKTK